MSGLNLPPSLRYIITGTGHCGTVWASYVAAACGLRSSHEAIFRRDDSPFTSDWECESSALAAPKLKDVPQDIRVIHLVRHPLDTIRSFVNKKPQRGWAYASRAFVEKGLGFSLPSDAIHFYMHFWVAWNELIEEHADVRVQLEDGQPGLEEALRLTAHKEVEVIGRRCPEDSPVIRWADLPNGPSKTRLYEKSIDYGYIPGVTTHWGKI